MLILILAGPYLVYVVFPLQAYRITEWLAFAAFLVALVFLIIAVVPTARQTAGTVLIGASFAIAPLLWVWSILIVGQIWGLGTVYFLNLFLGVGAVLGAFAASTLTAHWWILGQLLLISAIIFALRLAGVAIAGHATSAKG